jgi:hypothetical protein
MSAKKPPRGQLSPGEDILAGLDAAKATPRGQLSPGGATETPTQEVLPAALPRDKLHEMIVKARRHGRAFKRSGALLAVELRRLQDAGAHTTYGCKSFGVWAAQEFSDLGLSVHHAKKLSQAGRAILALADSGRVNLDDARTFPGISGARELSPVLASHGEKGLNDVFDYIPEGEVVASTVKQAIAAVLPPAPPTATPPPAIPHEDDEDDEQPEELPSEVQELRDRVERLRDLLDDIVLADDADPITIARQYEHFLEDAEALRPALDAVLPTEPAQ